jgi:hypothetical protein
MKAGGGGGGLLYPVPGGARCGATVLIYRTESGRHAADMRPINKYICMLPTHGRLKKRFGTIKAKRSHVT